MMHDDDDDDDDDDIICEINPRKYIMTIFHPPGKPPSSI